MSVKRVVPGVPLELSGEEALVFGRIRWIENSKERETYHSTPGWKISLKIIRADDMRRGTIKVEKDGRFSALIGKGTYVIHRLDWLDPWDGPQWIVPRVAFRIPENAKAYYIGTLVTEIETMREPMGGLRVEGTKMSVADEGAEALRALLKQHPDAMDFARTLMVHDKRIPRIDALETERFMTDRLRSLHFGITPMFIP
jgi:hypothetical protein